MFNISFNFSRFSALHVKEMELRYMDESSAVLPSPDAGDYGDDSSGISATDFQVPSSPTKARPDSQGSATSVSPTPAPPPPSKSATFQSPIPEEQPSKARSYLYGRPLPRYATPPGLNFTDICIIKQ